ncbi:MAG: gliding motility-associated C-terminal domain-containing protein [Flavobacteriales bacterium]
MKLVIVMLVLMFAALGVGAQSDCNTAISVCNAIYDENNSPAGTGIVNDIPLGSCNVGGETNSAWYIFSPQSDGMFGFILEPSAADDYDWSLFDITDGGCAGTSTGLSPEISCNSYGENAGDPNSPTGISTANGGVGNVNGPGNLNGPPFNEDVPVTAGRLYALVVMNFSATLNGYQLNYTSSPVSIFDNTAPVIENITTNWCTGEVIIELSEEIDVSTLSAGDFALNDPAYTVNSFSTPTPDLSSEIQLTIGPSPLPPDLQLQLTTINGELLLDICDNELIQPIDLDLSGNFFFDVDTTRGCNAVGATMNVVPVAGALNNPVTLFVNGIPQPNSYLDALATGAYDITLTDNLGCSRDTIVDLISLNTTVTMPADAVLCSLSETFTAAFTGGLILWDAPAGITVSQPASGTTLISADSPGTYLIEATVNDDGCETTGTFNATFNYPPGSTTTVENASCFGICDGRVTVENASAASLTITADGVVAAGTTAVIDSLCAGNYTLEIEFSPACTSTESIQINEPGPVTAAFEPTSLILPFADPTVVLTSTSENADSLYWQVVGMDSIIYSDSIWELVFPQEPGLYDVQLMVYDSAGCFDVFTAPFEVRDDFRFYMPTGFTPNDDGLNDYLLPSFTYEPEIYHLQIFNRFGDIVFDSKDYREEWQGDYRGNGYYVPNGVYSYIVTTRGVERDLKTYKGTITVMR